TLGCQGKTQEAIKQLERAAQYREKIYREISTSDSGSNLVSSYCNLATEFFSAKKFKNAFKYYYNALKVLQKLPNANLTSITDIFYNIGICHFELGHIKDALSSLQDAK